MQDFFRKTIPALLAIVILAAAAGAQASNGGVSSGGGAGGLTDGAAVTEPVSPGCPNAQLGRRILRLGDCGGDVATLNWILKAKDYGDPALVGEFEAATRSAVQEFQRDANLRASGVFDSEA